MATYDRSMVENLIKYVKNSRAHEGTCTCPACCAVRVGAKNILKGSSSDPCKKYACQLQTCLKENVYQPSRCEAVIEKLRQCCIIHSANSVVCSGIDTSKPYEHNTVDYFKWEDMFYEIMCLIVGKGTEMKGGQKQELPWVARNYRFTCIAGLVLITAIISMKPAYDYYCIRQENLQKKEN